MQGSGVILFLLVGLWALALVPALLRRHDGVADSRAVEHFAHAMRVLSRSTPDTVSAAALAATRPAPAASDRPARVSSPVGQPTRLAQGRVPGAARPVGATRPAASRRPAPAAPTIDIWRVVQPVGAALAALLHGLAAAAVTVLGALVAVAAGAVRLTRMLAGWRPARRRRAHGQANARPHARRGSGRRSSAARRRRTLLLLVVAEAALVAAAFAVGGVLWGPASCVGVLLIAFVGHLRAEGRRAARAAQARRRRAADRLRAQAAPTTSPSRPVPPHRPTVREPASPAMRQRPAVAVEPSSQEQYAAPRDRRTTATLDVPLPPRTDDVRPAADGTWHPVDVPLPTYVTKAAAPQRPAERPRPGHWSDGLSGEPGIDPAALDQHGRVLDRPRAVGD